MTTNVLALPLAHLVIETGNNEDWIDSLVFLVTPADPQALATQLDLRGLAFDMHIRRRAPDNEIVVGGATGEGSLSIGAAPNFGHLIFFVPRLKMQTLWAGQYVGDVRASDSRFERVCLTLELTVIEGVTR